MKSKSEIIEIEPINISAMPIVTKESETLLANAKQIIITTQPLYLESDTVLKRIKAKINELEANRKTITGPLDTAKKRIMDLFRAPTDYLKEAEQIIKSAQIKYLETQEKIRQEQETKLRQQAEKQRQEAEAKAEELRRKAAEAAANGDTAKATKIEQKAQMQEVKAETIVAPTLAPVELAKGSVMITRWFAEVVDFAALSDDYKLPNQSKLDAMARASKGTLTLPGVIFRSEKTMSVRRETSDVGF